MRFLNPLPILAFLFVFGNPLQAAFTGFQPQVVYPVGNSPGDITLGDFNGDGILDIAVVNSGDNALSVLLGNGDGTFQSRIVTPGGGVGGNLRFLTAADFNGDGKADLAVTDSNLEVMKIFLSNGDGTFQPPVSYTTQSIPYGVIVGDFNGDNIPDVAVTNVGSDSVSVFLGIGDGTFQPQVISPSGGSGPIQLAAGDFNDNGTLDLAVINQNDSTLTILIGNGDGSFQSPTVYPTNGSPNDITVGDFTSNGTLSIAVADGSLGVFLGNGDGTFQTEVSYPAGSFPFAITAVDLEGNGTIDLALTDANSNNVGVYLGNGNGTFQTPTSYATGVGPAAVVAGNLNGLPGLAIPNFLDNTVSVLLQNAISPPLNVQGSQIQNRFLTQAEFANVITWSAPTTGALPVAYRIYQDAGLTQLLAEIPATQTLRYVQHNRIPGQAYTYYLVSVDGGGTQSTPTVVTIR